MNLINEIKSCIKILDLVQEFGLSITRNNFIKSIYKDERTPSLKIYDSTNTYKDYSTGKQGDVIDFYKDFSNISFRDALKELTAKAGLNENWTKKIIRTVTTPMGRVRKTKQATPAKKLLILKSELEYFDERAGIYEYLAGIDKNVSEVKAMNDLMNERKEKEILIYESLEKFCFGLDEESFDYLTGKERGLNPSTIKKFKLFYIKDLKLTTEFLKDCFSIDDLVISGLFNYTGKFVFAHHRLIIPYIDNGKINYLRGRLLPGLQHKQSKPSKLPKYISLNNFAGCLSSKRFFNVDVLRTIMPQERLLLCEGEFDTIIMEQQGFRAIGIPGVTNIPEDQINSLKDYDIYIALDKDISGINAMHKLVKLINKPVKVIKLKHHKDLTELFNEGS